MILGLLFMGGLPPSLDPTGCFLAGTRGRPGGPLLDSFRPSGPGRLRRALLPSHQPVEGAALTDSRMTSRRPSCLFLSIATLGSLGCDGFEPGAPPPTNATTILSLEVVPNPVVSGDSLTFRTVVADSLRDDLLFSWFIAARPFLQTRTSVHRTVATESPGVYNVSVHVDRDGSGFVRVNANLDFQVLP